MLACVSALKYISVLRPPAGRPGRSAHRGQVVAAEDDLPPQVAAEGVLVPPTSKYFSRSSSGTRRLRSAVDAGARQLEGVLVDVGRVDLHPLDELVQRRWPRRARSPACRPLRRTRSRRSRPGAGGLAPLADSSSGRTSRAAPARRGSRKKPVTLMSRLSNSLRIPPARAPDSRGIRPGCERARVHPAAEAPRQGGPLIAGKIESAGLLQHKEQFVEFGVAVLGWHSTQGYSGLAGHR